MRKVVEFLPAKSWKSEFARSTDAERYREILRKANDEARKKDRDERAEQSADADDVLLAVVASETDLAEFAVTLDQYDAATYEALVENGRLLDIVRQEREEIFAKAYELPDGRRVFETEDGLRVFDEHGEELDASEVTADEIEDWRPKWEQVLDNKRAEEELLEDRQDITEYQTELELAREGVKDGDISQQELKALERKLAEEMPDSVREHLAVEHRPELANAASPAATAEATVQRPAANLSLPVLD